MEPQLAFYMLTRRRQIPRRHATRQRRFEKVMEEGRRHYLRRRRSAVFTTILLVATLNLHRLCTERMLWSKIRSDHWWENIVKVSFSDSDWGENFRVSLGTFHFLCTKLKARLKKKDTIMRKSIAVDERLAIALWFLARGCDFHTIGHLFGVQTYQVSRLRRESHASE